MPVRYILTWLDTEDYVAPAADDAALFVAETLSRHNLVGTFKVVGEKARVLERRGRRDAIKAIARHAVGFHTDFHSKPPTVPVYLEPMADWDESVAEFERREGRGVEDVKHIFGKEISCYGQPGTGWAPQAHRALLDWHVPLYLDGFSYVGLDGGPFWFQNVLTVCRMKASVYVPWQDAEPAAKAVELFRRAMDALPAGGIISFGGHPCELCDAEWWDVVNFSGGVDRDPSAYVAPRQFPSERIAKNRTEFEKVCAFVENLPGVKSVGPDAIVEACRDTTLGKRFTREVVEAAARRLAESISFLPIEEGHLSAAQAFYLLADFAAAKSSALPAEARAKPVLGPKSRAETTIAASHIPGDEVVAAARRARRDMDKTKHLPSAVEVSDGLLSAGDFCATLAGFMASWLSDGARPERAEVRKGRLDFEKYMTGLGDCNDWPPFPPDFHAPRLEEFARLQAWTIKPAVEVSRASS